MVIEIFRPQLQHTQTIPFYLSPIRAGFPSPADDYIEQTLDLNEYLVRHPVSTFYVRVKGDSMIGAGIFSGDILIVDRSAHVSSGKIVVAIVNGEFTVKRLAKKQGRVFLVSENPRYSPIEITQESEFEVWGVVIHVIHHV